jgi:hypothetical protein
MAPVSRRASVGDELTRWFAYGVLLSLLPLVVHAIFAYLQARHATGLLRIVDSTIADGELLLVSCCIGAGALGERIGKSSAWPRLEPFFAVSCLVCVAISIFTYGIIRADAVGQKSLIPTISLLFFGLTVLSSAALMVITFHGRAGKRS